MSFNLIKPQETQIKFLSNTSDICIFGGGAGGGKTFSLLVDPLRYLTSVNNFGAVIFRRTYPEIKAQGSLIDTSQSIYNSLYNCTTKYTDMKWDFYFNKDESAKLTFSHLQHEKDVHKFQGSQIPYIGFDELTHFSEQQFFYMLSRNRSPLNDVPNQIRCTTNPDPDSWVKKLLRPFINQETGFPDYEMCTKKMYFIRKNFEFIFRTSKKEFLKDFKDVNENQIKSISFIPSLITDNKIFLENNKDYLGSLALLDDYTRMILEFGNWNAKKNLGNVVKNPKFIKNFEYENSCTMYIDPSYEGKNLTALSIGFKKDKKNYVAYGESFKESIDSLYEKILVIATNNNCTRIIIETNKDEGLSRKELKRIAEKLILENPNTEFSEKLQAINFLGKRNTLNKHVRILSHVRKNWNDILFFDNINTQYMDNVLSYKEGLEPDDDIDSLCGLIMSFSTSFDENNYATVK